MIKPELYHKTVGILYDAYFNDTLVHGNCYACAVGNMVAANCGYQFTRDNLDWGIGWLDMPYPAYKGWGTVILTVKEVDINSLRGSAKQQIESTGYSPIELSLIEGAFENAPWSADKEDRMFNGLVAVLEVLAQIHQVTDEDLLTANNKRFKDHYNKKVLIG